MTLLIFDCDGVLVDSEILHAQIESDIGREMLGIDRDLLTHHRRFSGGGLKNLYIAWEQELGRTLSPDVDQEMLRRKNGAFSTQLKAIPHVAEALSQLPQIQRCVASGSPLPTLEIALRTTDLYEYFAPNIFSSESVPRGKPAPDIFLFAAQQMGVDPKDCLVIEDSVHGVNAALAAHMKVVGFVGGGHCSPDYAEKLKAANRIIGNMDELPAVVRDFCDGKLSS